MSTLAFCADESVKKPEVRVGDRWKYRTTDLIKFREISTSDNVITFVGADTVLMTSTNLLDKTETDSHWTAEWNARALSSGEVFDQPRRLFRFPLRAGDTFETSWQREATRGSPLRFRLQATVNYLGWEEVTVPIGKFRAFKVEAKGTAERLDARGSFSFTYTYWYVPEVERWVKYVFEDSRPTKLAQELLETSVK
jgi:hypothetical protein